MTMYERIRQLRIDAGMSQEDLAHAMGYKDRSMITKIESGKVDISQRKIIFFARVLNTTPSYLMGWTDEMPPEPPEDLPKNENVRQLVRLLNKLSPEQLDQVLGMIRIMFPRLNKYAEKDDSHEQ